MEDDDQLLAQWKRSQERATRIMKIVFDTKPTCHFCIKTTSIPHDCSYFRSDRYSNLIFLVGETQDNVLLSCKLLRKFSNYTRCPYKSTLNKSSFSKSLSRGFVSSYYSVLCEDKNVDFHLRAGIHKTLMDLDAMHLQSQRCHTKYIGFVCIHFDVFSVHHSQSCGPPATMLLRSAGAPNMKCESHLLPGDNLLDCRLKILRGFCSLTCNEYFGFSSTITALNLHSTENFHAAYGHRPLRDRSLFCVLTVPILVHLLSPNRP